jgi:putative addiction module component (TIGR02574 family)
VSVAEIKQELSRLTDAERIDLLEAVWASLDNKDEVESPAWHEAELRLREEEIASGKAKFIPWEEAKEEILHRTS